MHLSFSTSTFFVFNHCTNPKDTYRIINASQNFTLIAHNTALTRAPTMCLFFSFALNAKRIRLGVSSKEGVQSSYKSTPINVAWIDVSANN